MVYQYVLLNVLLVVNHQFPNDINNIDIDDTNTKSMTNMNIASLPENNRTTPQFPWSKTPLSPIDDLPLFWGAPFYPDHVPDLSSEESPEEHSTGEMQCILEPLPENPMKIRHVFLKIYVLFMLLQGHHENP